MHSRASAINPAWIAKALICLAELRAGRVSAGCIAAAAELVPILEAWLEHEQPLPPGADDEGYFWDEADPCTWMP